MTRTNSDRAKPDLERLILSAVAGEEPAMDRLMRAYESKIRTWITPQIGKRLAGATQQDDLAQEVLVAVYRGIVEFKPGRDVVPSFEAWLKEVMSTTVLAAGRKAKAKSKTQGLVQLDEDLLKSKSFGRSPPSRGTRKREALKILSKAVDQLSLLEAEAVRAAYLAGRTQQEAAEALGISVGTLNSRLQRARASLREILRTDSFYFSSH